MDPWMQVDFAEADRCARRLDRLQRELAARAALGDPDTGGPSGPGPMLLEPVERAALDLALRLERLSAALETVAQSVRRADETYAARMTGLADLAAWGGR